MKDKLLMLFILFQSINPCFSQVNTTDSQVSKSIKDSKANGFFIKQYEVGSSTDKDIIVEEAWFENIWFYDIHFGKTVKTKTEYCQLCFKVKQTADLFYKLENYWEWAMQYPVTKFYVAKKSGMYELRFYDCNPPDSISLNLIKRESTTSGSKKNFMGTLNFRILAKDTSKMK